MMSKMVYAGLMLGIFYFTSCAITKNDNEYLENKIEEQISSELENSILVESLTDNELQEFEIRAVEKLIDFYDYLNLAANEKYDMTIKEEVKVATYNLFNNAQIELLPFENSSGIDNPLFIEECLNRQIDPLTSRLLTIKSSKITKHFIMETQDEYHGQVSYNLIVNHHDEQIGKTAEVILKKIEKNFGDESIQIWEVFLAEIR